MEMTAERWAYLESYAREVFGAEDAVLARLREAAREADLPDIAVSPEVGRLLMIQVAMTRRRLALEVGTLGGYSGIWILRGLGPDGRLVTIEMDPRHADFALRWFAEAGVADRAQLVRGRALDVLPDVAARLGPASVDVVFLDADKVEYPDYWRIIRPLVAPGGIVLADNAYGAGWWIGDEDAPAHRGMDAFNRAIAGDPEFDAVAVPIRNGVLIARRREE